MLFLQSLRCCLRGNSRIRLISTGNTLASSDNDGKPPVPMIDLEDKSLPIPIYKEKQNEPLKLQKSRLLYQSRKRGMLENGLLLSTFADKYLESMDAKHTKLYDTLINMPTNDWDIFYWATNVKPTPPEYDNEVMNMLKDHVKNADRELRIRQPDLK
ncbi:succinate dehydrogenase assembly factor 2, mitochondrial [Toxorhynchites rutilus septentrionalis]|uniref:succinate dehydrogenase assembly factor 2, mitochondrial n=1 Tax=Toxorhynchites rutilus septentrionalis TaxID=329112 RepID=UPI002479C1EC|nr:succinate dehydrogenase assembly factor 2, mitochondrial [Toxorhynchites rutilus septentrionalis]